MVMIEANPFEFMKSSKNKDDYKKKTPCSQSSNYGFSFSSSYGISKPYSEREYYKPF